MCQSLPTAMLAQVTALGAALAAAAEQQRDAPLADLEAAVGQAVPAALLGLLTAVVQLAIRDLDPGIGTVRRRGPRCDQPVRPQSRRPRTVQTTSGPRHFTRPWYPCARCHEGFSPVDATLALPPRARISPALTAGLVRLNVATTHREAAAVLTALTGLVIGMDTMREHTTAVGQAVAAAERAAIARVQAGEEAAEPVEPPPGRLVVEADGAMVRYTDGWHEVKVGVVGGVRDGDLIAASSIAAREAADAFGPRLLTEAARRGAVDVVRWEGPLARPGLAVLRPVPIIGDGAPWIWNLAGDAFGARTEVVDFYHAAEHLWTVARALYGAEGPAAKAWADTQIQELREHGGLRVRQARGRARAPTAAAAEVLRVERGYFATNASRIADPAIADHGLPIGSGAVESSAVESSAKHVVQQRMKRPGQRWSCRGAAAMLARARHASARPLTATPPGASLLH